MSPSPGRPRRRDCSERAQQLRDREPAWRFEFFGAEGRREATSTAPLALQASMSSSSASMSF
eukprot:4523887-Alexandrium_andersonii.AAC.1